MSGKGHLDEVFMGIKGLVHIVDNYTTNNLEEIMEDINDLKWYLEHTKYTKKEIIEEIEYQKAVVISLNEIMKIRNCRKRKIELKIYLQATEPFIEETF